MKIELTAAQVFLVYRMVKELKDMGLGTKRACEIVSKLLAAK